MRVRASLDKVSKRQQKVCVGGGQVKSEIPHPLSGVKKLRPVQERGVTSSLG
jgi:hypothetical protein